MTKHDFALLLGVPPEGADVGHEAVSVSVHGHAAVRPRDGPDKQRASAGSKGHGLARVPAPAEGGGRPWNRGDVVTAESSGETRHPAAAALWALQHVDEHVHYLQTRDLLTWELDFKLIPWERTQSTSSVKGTVPS